MAQVASLAVDGSHSRKGELVASEHRGTGRGIQPSSKAFVKYASDPTRRMSTAAPAFRIASLTSAPSSHGPKNSHPALPAIVCCTAQTLWPAMVTGKMCDLGTSGRGPPVSCSMSSGARAFHLESVQGAPAGGIGGHDLVGLDRHVPTAGLGAVPHPVVAGRPAHEHELLGATLARMPSPM